MSHNKTIEIFGEWFVMGRDKIVEWDVLIKKLEISAKFAQPLLVVTTYKQRDTQ